MVGNAATIKDRVMSSINRLYSKPNTNTPRRGFRREKPSAVSNTTLTAAGTFYREWTTNIVVNKDALDAPFIIHIFLGPFNDQNVSSSYVKFSKAAPSKLRFKLIALLRSFDPNLVASHVIFHRTASGFTTACATCDDHLISGAVPLTEALQNKIQKQELKSLEPRDVAPFLDQNFRFRVRVPFHRCQI